MRILHVYRTYFPETQGGLEEVIRQICFAASRAGNECDVFTLADQPTPHVVHREEATVHRFKRHFEIASCSISLTAGRAFARLANAADLIHYHFPWPFADVLHLALRSDAPAVVTYHSDIVRQRLLGALYGPLMHRFLSSVDRIVCTSPNYGATSRVLARYQQKIDVVPIGLDESTYPVPNADLLARTERQYGTGFFLFIGVLRQYKGLHILLDAMKGAPYRVLIVGSGPMEAELRAQAVRLQLDNVTFAGHVPDDVKVALLRLCRGVVLPSHLRSEAFGVTLLEGAMHARPLISTEVGSGTSYVNEDARTGFVVAPDSPRALRDAMDRLYANPALAEDMGIRARARYERLFTGKQMGERYLRIYRDLLGPAPSGQP